MHKKRHFCASCEKHTEVKNMVPRRQTSDRAVGHVAGPDSGGVSGTVITRVTGTPAAMFSHCAVSCIIEARLHSLNRKIATFHMGGKVRCEDLSRPYLATALGYRTPERRSQ